MNLANRITVFRLIIFFPFVILLSLFYFFRSQNEYLYSAAAIFVLAMFSDFLDGYIARKQNTITTFGKLFDPLADKIITNTALIALSVFGYLPIFVTALFIARDIIVDGSRNIAAANKIEIAASIWGKYKTIIVSIGVSIVLFLAPIFNTNNIIMQIINIPIYIGLILSLVSGIQYLSKIKEYINAK
ncbi:CDP-diacylglycerol--glycerol-3-phosphate 3-phosphatidyltransferase [[Mycoplasma] mobile]|uniref:CDP-diacylglycerol--glycerol-3-phosphate 3-phosphatidyltransferase n=1 Tax=Mycoplasma mobile (strain ATCC 43663 / 163K / NCTC 11711) TaxID=267748 RepID=Q6KHT5_MYCM1|nr:CDP-diacylglycerol--glycerol-3-phosphate 3-phosphatidyltransferase [[Mycoplasma] mobile]AAT27843.1 phosphatidylglycerophosphate synthase [Mycoplasma mobile 163K]